MYLQHFLQYTRRRPGALGSTSSAFPSVLAAFDGKGTEKSGDKSKGATRALV